MGLGSVLISSFEKQIRRRGQFLLMTARFHSVSVNHKIQYSRAAKCNFDMSANA